MEKVDITRYANMWISMHKSELKSLLPAAVEQRAKVGIEKKGTQEVYAPCVYLAFKTFQLIWKYSQLHTFSMGTLKLFCWCVWTLLLPHIKSF